MKLHRGLEAAPGLAGGCVATIGKFDGVHLGHQALLARLVRAGRAAGLPAVVVSFEPLPAEYFDPAGAPPRLTPLGEKLAALQEAQVDRVWLLRFDARLAALRAKEFIRRVLVDGLHARQVLVGDDFRFGRDRAGDLALLQAAGARAGFAAHAMPSFHLDGQRVSSGSVRKALAMGDLDLVRQLLGRPYALCGRVVRGEQLGRRLGFPTANLAVRHRPALDGVFAVRVDGIGPDALPGVASLGTRPTVGGARILLEVHLFDYSGNLYGRRIQIRFVKKLRDEHRFESLEDMIEQMQTDSGEAREILL